MGYLMVLADKYPEAVRYFQTAAHGTQIGGDAE